MYLKHWFIYIFIFFSLFWSCSDNALSPTDPFDLEYIIEIDPAEFESQNITGNDYFYLIPGTTYVYEGEDEDGTAVRVEEEVLDQTKIIMGVTCRIVNAREYKDKKGDWDQVEDTFDWYAQDNDGNIWYFGEDSKAIRNGDVVSTSGSWEAGQDGALPGILLLARPNVGLSYRQEYYKGEAEDVAQVISMSASVSTAYGTFDECLQTAEWSRLEPGIIEHKFYKEGTGLVYVEAVKGEKGFESLTDISKP